MIDSYDGGYVKALIDLEDIIRDYDLWFFQTFDKTTRTGTKSSYLTKMNFPKLMTFFIGHVPELITWGNYIEFKAKVGGDLEMVSEPDHHCTLGYMDGYKTALTDVKSVVGKYTGRLSKEAILSIIKWLMEAPYDPCKVPRW